MFILRNGDRALLPLDRHRNNLRIKPPRRNRPRCAYLRQQRKFILLLARNLVLLDQNLRSLAHHHLRQRTKKSVAIHPIHHLLISQPVSPSRSVEIIRNPRHRLRPARQNAVRIPRKNRLISQRNRFHPRSTSLVHRKPRTFLRYATAHRNLPPHIRPTPSLPRAPKNSLVHLRSLNPSPLHRRLRRHHPRVRRSQRSKR